MYVGTEYNDEGYNVGGDDARVLKKTYSSEAEAKAGLKGAFKEILSDFNTGDIDPYDQTRNVRDFLTSIGEDEYAWDVPWSKYIKWAEENGVNWLEDAPRNLLQISEIEVD